MPQQCVLVIFQQQEQKQNAPICCTTSYSMVTKSSNVLRSIDHCGQCIQKIKTKKNKCLYQYESQRAFLRSNTQQNNKKQSPSPPAHSPANVAFQFILRGQQPKRGRFTKRTIARQHFRSTGVGCPMHVVHRAQLLQIRRRIGQGSQGQIKIQFHQAGVAHFVGHNGDGGGGLVGNGPQRQRNVVQKQRRVASKYNKPSKEQMPATKPQNMYMKMGPNLSHFVNADSAFSGLQHLVEEGEEATEKEKPPRKKKTGQC
jgi:hypothetical protein